MDVELIIAVCELYLFGLESDSVVGDYKHGHLSQISTKAWQLLENFGHFISFSQRSLLSLVMQLQVCQFRY
jgi:hypothetical protein